MTETRRSDGSSLPSATPDARGDARERAATLGLGATWADENEVGTRLRRVVSGRRRGWGRLTLRQRLVAVGGAGILLTLVVMQSALTGLGDVRHDDHTVDRIRQAQRFHQDADMQHDALHAAVYEALGVSAGQGSLTREDVLSDLDDDSATFQRDIDGAHALRFSGQVGTALESVRPKQEIYIATAVRLTRQAFTDRQATLAGLAPFEDLFRELETAQADVTATVAHAADTAEAQARAEASRSERNILAASALALAGLLVMAGMLSRMGKQLAIALGELEAHVDAVVRSEQRSRDFLAYAAHQLRTPVSTIQSSGEALLLMGASPDQEDLLARLVHETGRAGRLVNSLLRMARLDQGEALAPRPFDPVELCRRELERMQARAPSLRWVLDADGGLPERVMLSPDAVSEVLANLLDNARRHAHHAVTVRVSNASGSLKISVHDDGAGLSPSARVAAFERFASLDGHGGSGLGLPIARGLAEAQGGRLVYDGGRFVVTLPLEGAGQQPAAE